METELEALSTHVSRLESERTQLTASREKLMNNFSRLGLVGRREIGKLKQRVQYLAKSTNKRDVNAFTSWVNNNHPLIAV
ncbi:hypothetical protein FGIG_10788 [Fasciola gigantica]|uniref:Uncharacterized protein n=1 Tax=Fasciola gigantica TaxID=46835 RepID=A0A504YI07_FASGI|nr:hypothetical protein FGIG_10788 [Fasciola gigantica]